MITHAIRILMTILLLIGVYSETGLWTTIAIGLSFVSSEITAAIFRLQRKAGKL